MIDITCIIQDSNATLVRAFVLGIAAKLEPLHQQFEVKDGYFNLIDNVGDSITRQQVVSDCEFTYDRGLFCHSKMLYSVQGTLYVVNSGMFLVVAGYPHSFGNNNDDLITEVFYVGF